MASADKIRMICAKLNISIAELAKRTSQTPQNLNGKLKRDPISDEEFILIANVLEMTYEQTFTNRGNTNEFKC